MTYDEAVDSEVTISEAFAELKRHGITADHEGRELFDCTTGETIAIADRDGMFNGGDILAWLGY